MLGRIVDIASDNRHLFVSRGFLVIRDTTGDREELGRIPLDDIAAVIANAHGLSYTNNLLVALAERGVPFVLCASNRLPVGMLWPTDGHSHQSGRLDAQLAASKPLRKRLWAAIVKAKLARQAAVLEALGLPAAPLAALIRKVRSGDPENLEAQGARRYWPLLFGDAFRRDRHAGGVNGLLNYGYTVLRAATARSIIAAGLHPGIGLHHANQGNAMRLADDLMEPFRPLIDLTAHRLARDDRIDVTPDTRRDLVQCLYGDLQTRHGATPVINCLQRLATSLALVLLGEQRDLELPLTGLPAKPVSQTDDDHDTC